MNPPRLKLFSQKGMNRKKAGSFNSMYPDLLLMSERPEIAEGKRRINILPEHSKSKTVFFQLFSIVSRGVKAKTDGVYKLFGYRNIFKNNVSYMDFINIFDFHECDAISHTDFSPYRRTIVHVSRFCRFPSQYTSPRIIIIYSHIKTKGVLSVFPESFALKLI